MSHERKLPRRASTRSGATRTAEAAQPNAVPPDTPQHAVVIPKLRVGRLKELWHYRRLINRFIAHAARGYIPSNVAYRLSRMAYLAADIAHQEADVVHKAEQRAELKLMNEQLEAIRAGRPLDPSIPLPSLPPVSLDDDEDRDEDEHGTNRPLTSGEDVP